MKSFKKCCTITNPNVKVKVTCFASFFFYINSECNVTIFAEYIPKRNVFAEMKETTSIACSVQQSKFFLKKNRWRRAEKNGIVTYEFCNVPHAIKREKHLVSFHYSCTIFKHSSIKYDFRWG